MPITTTNRIFFLAGNFYPNNIQLGRLDADYGTILLNNGNNNFTWHKINGPAVRGQVRRMQMIKIGNTDAVVMAKNNDTLKIFSWQNSNPATK